MKQSKEQDATRHMGCAASSQRKKTGALDADTTRDKNHLNSEERRTSVTATTESTHHTDQSVHHDSRCSRRATSHRAHLLNPRNFISVNDTQMTPEMALLSNVATTSIKQETQMQSRAGGGGGTAQSPSTSCAQPDSLSCTQTFVESSTVRSPE